MQGKFKCVMLIDDRLTNFINKMIIDEVGCTEHVIRLTSGEKALTYLQDSAKSPDDLPFPEVIFLGTDSLKYDAESFLKGYNLLNDSFPIEPIIIILTKFTEFNNILGAPNSREVSGIYQSLLTKEILQDIIDKYFPPMTSEMMA